MKKLVALILTLCVLVALSGCGGRASEEAVTTKGTEAVSTTEGVLENVESGLVEVRQIVSAACLYDFDSDISSECRYEWEEDHLRVNCYYEDVLQLSHELYEDMQLHWEYEYDGDGRHCTSYEYSPTGCLKQEIYYEEDGSQWEYTYNDQGMPVDSILVDPDGNATLTETFVYDDGGLLLEHTEYLSDGSDYEEAIRHTWEYDEAGNQVQYAVYSNDTLMYTENWVYDDQGNILENKIQSYEDATSSITYNTYNEDGQLISSVCEGDYTSFLTYDEQGNLVEEATVYETGDVMTNSWSYDEAGNLLAATTHYDMDGWVNCREEYIYDDAGMLLEKFYEEGYSDEDPIGYRNSYTYDEAGNLIQEIHDDLDEAPIRTVYEYNAQGQRTLKEEYQEEELIAQFRWIYDEEGKLLDVGTDELESLAAYGDEVLMITEESGDVHYVAVKYETVRVQEADVPEFEQKNAYLLGLL